MANVHLTQVIDIETGSSMHMDEFYRDEGAYVFYHECRLRGLAKLSIFRNNERLEFTNVFVILQCEWIVQRKNYHFTPDLSGEFAAGQNQKVLSFRNTLQDWFLRMLDQPGKYVLTANGLSIQWQGVYATEPDAFEQDTRIKEAQTDIGKALVLRFGNRNAPDDVFRFGLNMDLSLNDLDQNPNIQHIRDILNKRT